VASAVRPRPSQFRPDRDDPWRRRRSGIEQDRWQEDIKDLDVVFDTIGGDVLARSAGTVKPGGALVSVASPPPTDRDDIRSIFFIRDPNRAQLVEIAHLVDAGELKPQVGAVYPLGQAREAFTAKSAGGIPGRVLLQP
jgi:NADPH:quinone reductase-like Zn-dependent oxidoreductase